MRVTRAIVSPWVSKARTHRPSEAVVLHSDGSRGRNQPAADFGLGCGPDAMEAADWAFNRGWDITAELPAPPAPDVQVESTTDGTAIVRWTDVTSLDGDVDGYKIWRAAQFRRTAWLDAGFRLVDRYHHQHEVGADVSSLDKSEVMGGVYHYKNGKPGDALEILQRNGLNYIRLRVWVDPADGYKRLLRNRPRQHHRARPRL